LSVARTGAALARNPSFLGSFLRYWLPVLAYVTLIFALSSIANLHPPVDWPNADKIAHLTEYSLLGILLARAFCGAEVLSWRFGCILLAVLVGFGTGILDELWQVHVPGRSSDPFDFLTDAIGIVCGQIVYALASAADHRRRNAE
jgi:VanZ family protein